MWRISKKFYFLLNDCIYFNEGNDIVPYIETNYYLKTINMQMCSCQNMFYCYALI